MMKLLLITGNEGKRKEITHLLSSQHSLQIDSFSLPLVEIQSMDPVEVGRDKTKSAFKIEETKAYDFLLTDDTALFLKAFNEFPGALVAWMEKSLRAEGIFDLLGSKSRRAVATSVLTLGVVESKKVFSFQGDCKGTIVAPSGKEGFGWDSIFQPEGFSETFAEIPFEKKCEMSHLYLASQKLLTFFATFFK